MRFSVKYVPTSLFSLKESNSTNSAAKALFLPSPYTIKMAIINQAIINDGIGQFEISEAEQINTKKVRKKKDEPVYFKYIRDAKISYHIKEGCYFSVNNSFVKILKPAREKEGFQQTVAYREYIHITEPIEIIFDVQEIKAVKYLKSYLHKINYFGKRGCFFQFLEYSDMPSEPNVKPFSITEISSGILQQYDDFGGTVTFEHINNFTFKKTIREKELLVLPFKNIASSKAFTIYQKV